MVNVKSLTVKYKQAIALRNVSFNVNKGDVVALLGKNGAGKSTLLKTLVGLTNNYLGDVKINGKVGWMSENSLPDPKLTVKEYISFCSYINKSNNFKDIILKCGLEKYSNTLCSLLSKGIMQRVILARTLLNNPDILILDEPSSGLDPVFQLEMIQIIKELSKSITIIISTHNIKEIEALATRFIILRSGQVSFNGNLKDNNYYEYF